MSILLSSTQGPDAFDGITLNAFNTQFANLYQLMTTLSTCLLQYKKDLAGVSNWVSTTIGSLSVIADMSGVQPTPGFLAAFNGNGSILNTIYTEYQSGVITKLQLAYNFTDTKYVGAIVSCADSLISDLQTSVFDELENIIAKQQSLVINTYLSTLTQFANLYTYMNATDTSIERFLRTLIIWRQPFVSLQAEQVGILLKVHLHECISCQATS